ncbi:hypothetical protein ACFSJM_06715 [Lactococcus formosensis subsp. bovis]|uniref:hypothetical protein n=1 Tax=Lactococcus formosensis TaxID=1281486 RepID=UPI001BCE61F9|nr:hypothetical protein [Lactococcus formosensis]
MKTIKLLVRIAAHVSACLTIGIGIVWSFTFSILGDFSDRSLGIMAGLIFILFFALDLHFLKVEKERKKQMKQQRLELKQSLITEQSNMDLAYIPRQGMKSYEQMNLKTPAIYKNFK